MVKCSHIKECRQKVVEGSLPLCHGEYKYKTVDDFDKCYHEHSLDAEGMYRSTVVKRAEEWASATSS